MKISECVEAIQKAFQDAEAEVRINGKPVDVSSVNVSTSIYSDTDNPTVTIYLSVSPSTFDG